MPFPIAAAISGGAAVLGTAGNILSTASINKKTRKWNEQQYAKQRTDALSDWTRQTDYDSPTSQMERLRVAGLNPNLVYGSGGAIQQAPAIRSTETKPWTPHAPQVDPNMVGTEVSRIYETQQRQAQTDNFKALLTQIAEQTALTRAQTLATYAGTGKTTQELQLLEQEYLQRSKLNPISLEAADLSTRKQAADISFTQTQEEINILQSSTSIKEALQRMSIAAQNATKIPLEKKEIEARTENLILSGELQKMENELKADNVYPGDAAWQRAIQRMFKTIKERSGKYKIDPLKVTPKQ